MAPSIFSGDDDLLSADDDLRAAVDSATSNARAAGETPLEPVGFSWRFDFRAGRFVRRGLWPSLVTGTDALAQWCMLALRVERFSCPAVLPDAYGIERLDDPIGGAVDTAALRDLESRVTDCLMVHDRITGVRDFSASYTEDYIEMSFVVMVDGGDEFNLTDQRVPNVPF